MKKISMLAAFALIPFTVGAKAADITEDTDMARSKSQGRRTYISFGVHTSNIDLNNAVTDYKNHSGGGFAAGFYPSDSFPLRLELEYARYASKGTITNKDVATLPNGGAGIPSDIAMIDIENLIEIPLFSINAYLHMLWDYALKPYVGLGIGYGRFELSQTGKASWYADTKLGDSASDFSLVPQAMAGLDWHLKDLPIVLSTEYRFAYSDFTGQAFGEDMLRTKTHIGSFRARYEF